MALQNNYNIVVGEKGAKATERKLNKVNNSLSSMAKKVIGVTAVYYGTKGLINAFVGATREAGNFQQGILEISTLLGNVSNNQLKQMSQGLASMSINFGQTLDALQTAQYDAISAGFSDIAESQTLLASASKLAVGGVSDVSSTTDLLTSILNAYNLEGDKAVQISDALFTTVKLGKTTINELGASFANAVPFAKSAGLNVDQLGASLALMTTKGINTAESVTALSGLFRSLSMPTEGARKAMEKLGIEIINTDDGSVDLIKTLKQFEGLDPAMFQKVAPDVRTKLALETLLGDLEGLQDNLDEFAEKSGASDVAFEKMTNSWNFQMAKATQGFATMRVAIGEEIINALLPKLKDLNKGFEEIGEIGWDNIGRALTENYQVILDRLIIISKLAGELIGQTLLMNIAKAFDSVTERMGFFGKKIFDIDFNFQEWGDSISNVANKLSTELASSMDFIKTKAVENKEQQDENIEGNEKEAVSVRKFGEEQEQTFEKLLIPQLRSIKLEEQKAKARQFYMNFINTTSKEEIKNAYMTSRNVRATVLNAIRDKLLQATAGGIASIMSSVPFPFNIALSATIGSAINNLFDKAVSSNKAKKYEQGGLIGGRRHSQGGTIIEAEQGEFVMSRDAVSRIGINNLNAMNQGGSGTTINISAPLLDDTIVDSIIPKIEEAVRRGSDLGV